MRSAVARGIQQVVKVMRASFASWKVGTAINATTAGRMPRNMAATQGMSMNW